MTLVRPFGTVVARVDATLVSIPLKRVRWSTTGQARHATRWIVTLETNDGLTGVGEVSARVTQNRIQEMARHVVGMSPFWLERIRTRFIRGKFYSQELASLHAAIEMACLDIQGKLLNMPVAELLGGRLRDAIPIIAYQYRCSAEGGASPEVDLDDIVNHARSMISTNGFSTLKFKGGAASPAEDVRAVLAINEALPDVRLRLDPNASWTVPTSLRVIDELRSVGLEWLEDPTAGMSAMAEVTRRGGVATATNMCVTHGGEIAQAALIRAVDVVLLDLWYIGGLTATREFAATCGHLGFAIGMHAGGGSDELGVGLAAMLHVASTLPDLRHDADSLYDHLTDDVVDGQPFHISNGSLQVPTVPGLGVTLNAEKVATYARAHTELSAAEAAKD